MPYLYEIEKGSKIRLELSDDDTRTITFHRLDGSYSFCTCKEGPIHLAASTPLKKASDGVYEVEEKKE